MRKFIMHCTALLFTVIALAGISARGSDVCRTDRIANEADRISEISARGSDVCSASETSEPVMKELYDLITPEYIEFYEKHISKEPVITNVSRRKLTRIASSYNVSENKVRAVLACQNLAALNGRRMSVSELMKLPERDFIKLIAQQTQIFTDNLSEEEKIILNEEFKKLKAPAAS
ncbi:MAG: hypothetical protein LBC13_01740 [Clostridiales bacterium]|nr:hypothetical protein [Clostridiales bacterium]